MIWDGNCGFCKYWVIRWKQMTGASVEYTSYQKILDQIHDIPEWAYKEAARLVDTDGTIYNGPEAAYKALEYSGRWDRLFNFYVRSGLFRFMSDHAYMWIAGNRSFLFKITKLLWGSDPTRPAGYWRFYLLGLAFLVLIVISGMVVT
jgi:predicted DCC family thiol-disulfide oxidoreductase YuxK